MPPAVVRHGAGVQHIGVMTRAVRFINLPTCRVPVKSVTGLPVCPSELSSSHARSFVTVRFRLREVLGELEQAGQAMSQSELARRSGLSLSIINAIVQHRQRQVSLETLNKLCGALAVTPGDLFEFDPEKRSRRTKSRADT